MKSSKCGGAIAYAAATLVMTLFSVWACTPMYSSDDPVTAYLRSVILLFAAACGLLGVGVYTLLTFARRRPERRGESWFLMAFGGVVLILAVVVIARFGGMSDGNFGDGSYTAINLNLILFGLLPLPLWGRAVIAALSTKERSHRIVAWSAVAIAAALFIVFAASGRLLHTVRAAKPSSSIDYSAVQNNEADIVDDGEENWYD